MKACKMGKFKGFISSWLIRCHERKIREKGNDATRVEDDTWSKISKVDRETSSLLKEASNLFRSLTFLPAEYNPRLLIERWMPSVE